MSVAYTGYLQVLFKSARLLAGLATLMGDSGSLYAQNYRILNAYAYWSVTHLLQNILRMSGTSVMDASWKFCLLTQVNCTCVLSFKAR